MLRLLVLNALDSDVVVKLFELKLSRLSPSVRLKFQTGNDKGRTSELSV